MKNRSAGRTDETRTTDVQHSGSGGGRGQRDSFYDPFGDALKGRDASQVVMTDVTFEVPSK